MLQCFGFDTRAHAGTLETIESLSFMLQLLLLLEGVRHIMHTHSHALHTMGGIP